MASIREKVRAIDPNALPKHFEAEAVEKRWIAEWEERGVYRWDPERVREETFVIDTPPPTASGSLHVGHVFSYTHTDVIARYKRMCGMNIYYPMGWDDNGLPTERRVQNYFHVRCDPHSPYEEGLELTEANAKQRKKPARLISRRNFIEACYGLINEDEEYFRELWRRLALSVDWSQEYQTIDDHCREIAQYSFLDLFSKGEVYTSEAPTMWDVDFQCAVAQAEVEDKNLPGAYHHVEFAVEDSEASFVIATTRPELLPACVGVCAHPDDARYRELFGKRAVTPLFHAPVPIFASELADPEKGTGILMVCTFGDATDVIWWREQNLPSRQLISKNGRMEEITFGTPEFESLQPEDANRYYAEIAGKNVKQARKAMVELLRDPAGSATGSGAPLKSEPEAIEHPVKFYEKGDRPLEYLTTRQWFAKLVDKKEQMLAKGAEINWHPPHMQNRYRDWTENLNQDWCLSRQRYFGVAIPVWYPLDQDGAPVYDEVIVAERAALPVDPMIDTPPGYDEAQRDKPGGFAGEADIFDTWFTSSLTPQISSHWGLDDERHKHLFPADVRPQAHEIIRTWAFYTIAKGLLHENKKPWEHVMISGWILDPDRKKMSKSAGNVMTPIPKLEKYTADAGRYWAASARLGVDTAFDEKVWKIGKRLVTKLYNAGKFVLSQTGDVHPVTTELDRAFVAELAKLVERVTAQYEQWNFAHGLQETESFFWTHFTDTYLELAKPRARWHEDGAEGERLVQSGSAVAALRLGFDVLLRLFAPVLPYITEEIWSWTFAEEKGESSIHRAPWPVAADFAAVEAPADANAFELAISALAVINKSKADNEVSLGRGVDKLTLRANAATLGRLASVEGDVLAATRCLAHQSEEDSALEDGEISIREIAFAPKPEKPAK
ncbi:MAG: valine--tRNA ligase [bacterium]|nr:valine--tRNA ligase [bacterium]